MVSSANEGGFRCQRIVAAVGSDIDEILDFQLRFLRITRFWLSIYWLSLVGCYLAVSDHLPVLCFGAKHL